MYRASVYGVRILFVSCVCLLICILCTGKEGEGRRKEFSFSSGERGFLRRPRPSELSCETIATTMTGAGTAGAGAPKSPNLYDDDDDDVDEVTA